MPARTVDPYDFDRAMSLTAATGELIRNAAAANLPSVQDSVNSLVQDMVSYAKELLKTPAPSASEPDPEASATDAPPAE